MPKFTNNFGQRKPRPPDLRGSSANHLASPKIRMAALPTTWRTQKSVWQLRQPLGEPKNPYGSSANHLAGPKIRMADPPTAWKAQKSVWLIRQPLGRPKNPYG